MDQSEFAQVNASLVESSLPPFIKLAYSKGAYLRNLLHTFVLVHLKSYYFCELGAHAKFQNHTMTPSGRTVTKGSAHTSLGPK